MNYSYTSSTYWNIKKKNLGYNRFYWFYSPRHLLFYSFDNVYLYGVIRNKTTYKAIDYKYYIIYFAYSIIYLYLVLIIFEYCVLK